MNYRSYADLSRIVVQRIAAVPRDVDLVVAVPRSGYLAAAIIALTLNRKLIDLGGFLEGRSPKNGNSRKPFADGTTCTHALIVDDSVLSGESMQQVREQVSELAPKCRISYAAIFVTPQSRQHVDYHFDICPFPRQFEWNVFHHEHLSRCCVALDGVLRLRAAHGTDETTPPLIAPTYPVRHLIATHRGLTQAQTETWLKTHAIRYERLTLLDADTENFVELETLPRRKARLYARDHGAKLFIEEDPRQADQIARLAGKPVLCTLTQTLHQPPPFLVATLAAKSIQAGRAMVRRVRGFLE